MPVSSCLHPQKSFGPLDSVVVLALSQPLAERPYHSFKVVLPEAALSIFHQALYSVLRPPCWVYTSDKVPKASYLPFFGQILLKISKPYTLCDNLSICCKLLYYNKL